jgi:hypothetical protein
MALARTATILWSRRVVRNSDYPCMPPSSWISRLANCLQCSAIARRIDAVIAGR